MTNKMENKNDVTMEKNYTVYMHVCPNGKRYIGITRQKPEKRWLNGRGYKYNKHFWNAIQKYDWNNIEHMIIENNLTKEQAENMEIELIAKYRSNIGEYGYNIENGGNATGKVSEETKKKIRNTNGKSKKVYCNNLIFDSIRECASYNNVQKSTMMEWLNGNRTMNSDFQQLGLRIATENDLNECERYDANKHGDKANNVIDVTHRGVFVHCDNLIFNSITDCASYYNMKMGTIKSWLKGERTMNKDFQKLNLRYATENDLNKCEKYDANKHGHKASIVITVNENKGKKKDIHCNGMIFNSITDCSNYYNVKMATMSVWLLGKCTMNEDFQKLNLRYANNEDLNTYPRYTPVNN